MIKINATTHTKGGVTISTGSILNVKPHFSERFTDDSIEYDVAFDVTIYKNMDSYKSSKGKAILVRDEMLEYNIGFTAVNVPLLSLDSISAILDILREHIENGDANFPGVGQGNTEVVFPYPAP